MSPASRNRASAVGLFAVARIGPRGFAVQLRVLKEFLPERLVVMPPPVPAALRLFGGESLLGQAGVVSVLRPDLHVHVAHDAPVMTDRALRNLQIPVREPYDKHRSITLDAIA